MGKEKGRFRTPGSKRTVAVQRQARTARPHRPDQAQRRAALARQKDVGCTAQENGALRYRLRRPGACPGIAGRYRMALVYRTFCLDAFCRPGSQCRTRRQATPRGCCSCRRCWLWAAAQCGRRRRSRCGRTSRAGARPGHTGAAVASAGGALRSTRLRTCLCSRPPCFRFSTCPCSSPSPCAACRRTWCLQTG